MERPDDTRSLGLAYALIDIGVLLAAGLTARIAVLFVVSFLTKLAAGYLGAVVVPGRPYTKRST
jgi:hypothetical protein